MAETNEVIEMRNNCRDREYVLNAVKQNGKLLEFADESLRDDREIVFEAVNNNAESFEFASDRLKSDKEIAYSSVSRLRLDILLCTRKFTIR